MRLSLNYDGSERGGSLPYNIKLNDHPGFAELFKDFHEAAGGPEGAVPSFS
jgi:hypothetical protein